jgi:hypothetical protein
VECARVVSEDVTVGVISEVFRELHEAFCVVKHTARKGKAAGRHRGETGAVAHCVVVAIEEPRLDLNVDSSQSMSSGTKSRLGITYLAYVFWCEAKLLAYANRNPSALGVRGLQISGERLSSIVDGTKPDFECVAKTGALVLEGNNCLQGQLYEGSGDLILLTRSGRLRKSPDRKLECAPNAAREQRN